MKILVPFGTRPEIVKLAPVVAALGADGHQITTVATGQQFDPDLTDAFYDQLGLHPDERWDLPSDPAERLGTMTTLAARTLATHQPDLTLVLGDTNTVPIFALASRRAGVPLAHIEAGLRSFNPTSIEETNRKVAAVTASLHFAPTEMAAGFLRREGIESARIMVVGNPVCDVLRRMSVAALPVSERSGAVVTAHRATNVDDPERLARLVTLIAALPDVVDGPVTFPVHPRTAGRLSDTGLGTRLTDAGVEMSGPVPYDRMIELVRSARVVVTDSGGLQEEASWLGVPVIVMRRSTPRWEGVADDTSVLVGLDTDRALLEARRLCTPAEQTRVAAVPCPYGDGHTSERIAAALSDPETAPLLRIEEPDTRAAAARALMAEPPEL